VKSSPKLFDLLKWHGTNSYKLYASRIQAESGIRYTLTHAELGVPLGACNANGYKSIQ